MSNAESNAKVRVGTSVLSRDLVWCECGRGLALSGKWTFCPNCGRTIDQESYAEAVEQAKANGASHFYKDPELVEELNAEKLAHAETRERLEQERHVRETAERESAQHAERTTQLYVERDALREQLAQAQKALELCRWYFYDRRPIEPTSHTGKLVAAIDAALRAKQEPPPSPLRPAESPSSDTSGFQGRKP